MTAPIDITLLEVLHSKYDIIGRLVKTYNSTLPFLSHYCLGSLLVDYISELSTEEFTLSILSDIDT